MRNSSSRFLLIVGALVAFAALSFGTYSCTVGTITDITITVTDTFEKERNNVDVYMVDAEGETFENTDSWIPYKNNSSDLQRELKKFVGKSVRVKVCGWRSNLFSSYRNIVEILGPGGN